MELPRHQDYLTPNPPAHPTQTPIYLANRDMNISYPYPTISYPTHLPSNAQPPHALPLSISSRPLENLTDQNRSIDQQPLHFPQGQAMTATVSPALYQTQGMFSGSRDLTFSGNTFIDNSITSDNFMKEFLQHTIIGAAYDSSDRHPPPRCHPGTRLAIIDRCKAFIVQCNGKEKMRWVVGPAGVGKSAIMQIVAEETPADASVFLSANGRDDGTKTFTTIAYQLATKSEPYCQFIRTEIGRDPTLLTKSLPVQFQKFIVEPCIHRSLFDSSRQLLIVIDGLDECENPLTQAELLVLISDFCITYPTSPIVWFIASRPEPHITSFFDDINVAPTYSKEEIMVDSNEACEDVQRYLRDELNKIKHAYPTLKQKREWPSGLEFTKIATAAGGLFAYASTVVRYIGDPYYRNPVARLRQVLKAIDGRPKNDVLGKDHPMAQLDALYTRILSNIPADVMINSRKLLLIHSSYNWEKEKGKFRTQCNKLGLTEDAAYGAVSHLHAVVKVPAPDRADDESLEFFHKSFEDFLLDFERSGFCRTAVDEVMRLQTQCSWRIVERVPDDFGCIASDEDGASLYYGLPKTAPGSCDSISLSWPSDERFQTTDSQLRLKMYHSSMDDMCYKFEPGRRSYRNISIFHLLTTRFIVPGARFPYYQLRASAFDDFRSQIMELGKLKQVPLQALDFAAICGNIDFRFTRPFGLRGKHFDPWNPFCRHFKLIDDDEEGLQPSPGWTTFFRRLSSPLGDEAARKDIPRFNITAGKFSHWMCVGVTGGYGCLYCSRRFSRYLADNPEKLVNVFVDSTEMCYVELSFVDQEDLVLEWRYRFFHSGLPLCIDKCVV